MNISASIPNSVSRTVSGLSSPVAERRGCPPSVPDVSENVSYWATNGGLLPAVPTAARSFSSLIFGTNHHGSCDSTPRDCPAAEGAPTVGASEERAAVPANESVEDVAVLPVEADAAEVANALGFLYGRRKREVSAGIVQVRNSDGGQRSALGATVVVLGLLVQIAERRTGVEVAEKGLLQSEVGAGVVLLLLLVLLAQKSSVQSCLGAGGVAETLVAELIGCRVRAVIGEVEIHLRPLDRAPLCRRATDKSVAVRSVVRWFSR